MKYLSVDTLTFAEYNPRSIKDKAFRKLKENISRDREFFEARPCLINERDGKLVVYAGNQRLRAAIDLGWTDVPCIVHKIPLALEKERNIKDNRL